MIRHLTEVLDLSGQLIDATTGTHLWAERFEGTLDDIFELQDCMTESVVGAIEPRVRDVRTRGVREDMSA